MGLLDSDAEELKKNSSNNEGKSGRKVNQSGLGVFKGLSKYSSLTAKYRSTETAKALDVPVAPPVEQFRGTIDKSVQSGGELSANSVQNTPSPVLSAEISKVVAKSVQSTVEVSAPTVDKSLLNTDDREVSAKSVRRVPQAHLMFEPSLNVDSFKDENLDVLHIDKSVQSQCEIDSKSNLIVNSEDKVSAKSVPTAQPSAPVLELLEVLSVQSISQCEVGATTADMHENHPAAEASEVENQDLSKSVQSPGEVSAQKAEVKIHSTKNQVSAKSVQSGGIVGAKSVQNNSVEHRTDFEAIRSSASLVDQLSSKCIPKNIDLMSPTESVTSLTGSQRAIAEFLFQLCVWNNSLVTPPLTRQRLVLETGVSEETAISSIKRLRNKYIIDRHAYKDGKAGWTQYRFSETSYKELVHMQQLNGGLARHSQQSPVIPISASMPVKRQVAAPAIWFKDLDFSKVRPFGPMAVNASIRNLVQERLTPDLVQEFINRFGPWLATQGKISSPLGLFCDKLKELANEGDSPVLAIMTDEERKAEAEFSLQFERAKSEMAVLAKAKEAKSTQDLADQFEIEFGSWLSSMPVESLHSLIPGNPMAPVGSEIHKALIRSYFQENVWK